jgi:ABC-type uncharacterized transport system substrate-binding protein
VRLLGLGRAGAQTAAKPVEIGFVYEGVAAASIPRANAFLEGLRSKGYEEGRNVALVIRNGESQPDRFEPLVRELVQRDVKLLFAVGPAVTRLAKAATPTIPIVALDLESDPIHSGLVQSITRPSPLFGTNPKLIADLAIAQKLPAIMFYPEYARVGGLLAYGTNLIDLFFQAGVLVAKILGGEQPATLPVERPSRFLLVVNMRTASRLGVTVPTSILLRADEVIE